MTATESHPGLLISGLRRSGTTALWELMRSSPDLVAFDEPFHPGLWTGVYDNHKRTWTELTALWREGPQDLVHGVAPIRPLDELDPDLAPAQAAYLRALLARDRPVVIDVVRGWNKLPALAEAAPSVHLVLLVRSPVPWVLSHLIPSGGTGWRFALGTAWRRFSALRRRGDFDNWQYETILRAALDRRHPVFDEPCLSPEALDRAPAHVRLIALWWATNRHAYRMLDRHVAADRFDLLLAEDFMTDPAGVSERLLARAGLRAGGLACSMVRPPRRDPLQSHPAWARAFARLGLPDSLLPGAAPDSAALRAAFDATFDREAAA
jgi:hypothetical protein